ncbi:MAG: homocysteine S-methyltransferase family protein [Verrucomicrobia bacterium]|nr:homocysteine S-methyltransferase family protein [Verrucomicrobiota bacterium]
MNPRTAALGQELSKRPLLGDGATGTQLQAMGLAPGACGELWNTEHPDRVRRVNQLYLEAGSDLLTTNTFGGTSFVLESHGVAGRGRELNLAGARLAREIAGDRAWVLGDIGPFGGMLEPLGETPSEAVAAAFREQAEALIEGGADAILVETMSDPAEAALAVRAAKGAGAGLVLATYTFQKTAVGYRTMMGTNAGDAVAAVIAAGAEVVGANCGTELSLEDYERLTAELVAAAAGRPVIVQPNAGAPRLVEGRICYAESAGEFAAAAPRFLLAGARLVGGCCGSTPAHIAAMAAILKS